MQKSFFHKFAGQGPIFGVTDVFAMTSLSRSMRGTSVEQQRDKPGQTAIVTDHLADRQSSALPSNSMKILDVGCGANKFPGAIGLDYNEKTDADVIHDLGQFPYPFPDDKFDMIVSFHVIEHVPDVMGFVTELFRITKPGGHIRFVTPHYTNPDWASDPTHKNHFNSYSFDTFVPEKRNFKFYTDVNLRPVKRFAGLANLWKSLGIEWLVNLDHRHPGMRFIRQFWEHYLCTVIRGKEMDFEFEVVKDATAANS
jgi:SAM-dependent methyltransferase